MKSPFTGDEAFLVSETRKAMFRKEEYEYTHLCYRCADTGEEFTTTQMDTYNVSQVYNGYSTLSRSRLKNAMLFFIERYKGVFATLMNKLLFYMDFLSYRENGETITGLSYRAIQFDPVPGRWDRVYSLTDDISQVEVECTNGNVGGKLVSEMSCDRSAFTAGQLAVLERVYETFRNDTSSSISAKNHQEPAWIENKDTHSFIDFKYAFLLKAI